MPMKYRQLLQVRPGSKVSLAKIDPGFTADHTKRKSAEKEVAKLDAKLRELQYLLYAEGKRSLLICLQALDAAGKDGTINHVLGSMNPQGARVHGFKAPTPEELSHDFLWRIEQQVPKKGEVVIFNRSHYEDVLVVRVHNLVPEEVWRKRYAMINAFEKGLIANGTHIIKIFLHISPEEQLRRFKQRLDDPARHWKISEGDYSERAFWDQYTKAYEDALSQTSTKHAPWYVIPANHKWFRNLAVAKIVVETMKALNMKFPKPTVDLAEVRRKYHAAEQQEEKKLGKKKWKKLLAKQEKKEAKAAKAKKAAKPKAKAKPAVGAAAATLAVTEPVAEPAMPSPS
jgi:PPK2 family polyphosphate:nucleotide phosphotransferase